MINFEISPYRLEDNAEALELERLCPQGKDLILRFVRPSFQARSGVYDNYKIFTAKLDGKLIGIAAGARKNIILKDNVIPVIYGYDLRVHPDFRKYGTAKILTDAVIKGFGEGINCAYTLVAGENDRAINFFKRGFGANVVIPLVYLFLPIYKKVKEKIEFQITDEEKVHNNFMKHNKDIDFISVFDRQRLFGHVKSISLGEKAGGSIWTNENIFSEQVVSLPFNYNVLRIFSDSIRPLIKLPVIPQKEEIIKSWFLYDLYAKDYDSLSHLLNSVNNLAYEEGKKFIYILLRKNDNYVRLITRTKKYAFKHPYYFIAKGSIYPDTNSKIYIDIRDL